MTYAIIQPPFTLEFEKMSKQELRAYSAWFHSVVSERIAQLEQAVRATAGYESWAATMSRDSLASLGDWFAQAVSTRQRTADEVAELRARTRGMTIADADWDLTNEAFSFAFDIGLYLASTMQRIHPQLNWKQPMGSKNFADYGQPVLSGFGKVDLNPIRIAVTLAYQFAAVEKPGSELLEAFDYWMGLIAGRTH